MKRWVLYSICALFCISCEKNPKHELITKFDNNMVAAESFGGGNGTQGAPYLINDVLQLKKLVDDVNSGNNYANTYFRLMTNIEVTADEWIPIGDNNSSAARFRGIFDGNNQTISGTLKSNKYSEFGFFGFLGEGARIADLAITAAVKNEGEFVSASYETVASTGAIAGRNYNANIMIINCHITGTVTGGIANHSYTGGVIGAGRGSGSIIQDCSVSGQITGGKGIGSDGWVTTGGIAGALFEGEINHCSLSESAKITGGECEIVGNNRTGGITGNNQDRITGCTNNAVVSGQGVAGGLVGYNSSVIHTGLNTGNVSGNGTYSGGLAGFNSNGEQAHIYSCCTGSGSVNNQTAGSSNQIGSGKNVETCPDGHAKR